MAMGASDKVMCWLRYTQARPTYTPHGKVNVIENEAALTAFTAISR